MHKALICLLVAVGLAFPPPSAGFIPLRPMATAIGKITKHAKALSDEEVRRLATLAGKNGGTKLVGRDLGAKNLPNEALEDAYLRIAIQQGKVPRQEAEGYYMRLSGVAGFRSALSKVVGNSDVKTAGHLNEIKFADSGARNNFRVKGIGVPFNDPKKGAPTDIDVLLERGGREVAIEAKDYRPDTLIPLDKFRADMDSLVQYKSSKVPQQVLLVFSLTHKPADPNAFRLLEKEAERRGIQLIVGSPDEQIHQIHQLHQIL